MRLICAKLVGVAHGNHLIKSLWIYFCDFLVLYLKTTSLNSLKIMKESPIPNIMIGLLSVVTSTPLCKSHDKIRLVVYKFWILPKIDMKWIIKITYIWADWQGTNQEQCLTMHYW